MVILGGSLGFATQTAPATTSMGLRVPALFAALLMVAEGLLEFERALRHHRMRVPAATADGTVPGEIVLVARPGSPASTGNGRLASLRPSIPLILMLLALWLGLAVLFRGGHADKDLAVLATISTFLLFTLGWSSLLGTR
jgi:hypothetical protein